MATVYALDEPVTSTTKPVLSTELKPLPLISETGAKFYKTTYQVGPYIGGPAPGSGKFLRTPSLVIGEPDRVTPDYRVYDQILPTAAINGKIVRMNDWLEKNARKNQDVGGGRLGDMTAVLHYEEVKGYVPPSMTFANVEVNFMSEMIRVMVAEQVTAQVAALTKPVKN